MKSRYFIDNGNEWNKTLCLRIDNGCESVFAFIKPNMSWVTLTHYYKNDLCKSLKSNEVKEINDKEAALIVG